MAIVIDKECDTITDNLKKYAGKYHAKNVQIISFVLILPHAASFEWLRCGKA
jgi:hypothetical protein